MVRVLVVGLLIWGLVGFLALSQSDLRVKGWYWPPSLRVWWPTSLRLIGYLFLAVSTAFAALTVRSLLEDPRRFANRLNESDLLLGFIAGALVAKGWSFALDKKWEEKRRNESASEEIERLRAIVAAQAAERSAFMDRAEKEAWVAEAARRADDDRRRKKAALQRLFYRVESMPVSGNTAPFPRSQVVCGYCLDEELHLDASSPFVQSTQGEPFGQDTSDTIATCALCASSVRFGIPVP
jgi:hypothetical protein